MVPVSNSRASGIRYPGFALLLLIWTLLGTLACTRHLLLVEAPHGHFLQDLAGWLTCYYPWVLLTPLVFRMERRFPLNRSHWPQHLAWLSLAGLPLSYLAGAMALALNVAWQLAFSEPLSLPVPWWSTAWSEFLMQLALYLFAMGGACVLRNLIELQESERRAAQLALEKAEIETSLRKAELETLRMRLNPHFLFNCLQNISTLARQDPDTASQMLTRLGDLLRAALRKGAQAETTLASEIALTKAYVAVEQMRFADRLSVFFEVEPGIDCSLVPTFVLQPLVENAITHGLRGPRGSGEIWIRGIRQLHQLVLTVSDNGSGPPKEKLNDLELGIGLGSTCERLERMYPGQHSLSIQKLPQGGTEVRIVVPLQFEEKTMELPAHEIASIAYR
jgi:two-component system, LytTR family, sensor kinase